MPIADLLGDPTDMHILGKLSLTVAVVLVVSWAFRFYSSRTAAAAEKRQNRTSPDVPPQEAEAPPNGTCRRCRGALRRRSSSPRDPTTEEEEPAEAVLEDLVLVASSSPGPAEGRTAQTGLASPGWRSTEGEAAPPDTSTPMEDYLTLDPEQSLEPEHSLEPTSSLEAETETGETRESDPVSDCTLQLPGPGASRPVSPSGRRSPCSLQRLEGTVGVGVGRELRQDLGLQGAYSSFLSKAEITVEEARVVLEGAGDQGVVRGKIYEYHVESSSQSFSESSQASGKREWGSLEPPLGGVGSRGSSLSDSPSSPSSPSSLSPAIVRDLVSPPNGVEVQDPGPPATPEPRRPDRPVLLRKESYLTAAEQSELHIPTPTPRASTQRSPSQGPYGGDADPSSPLSPSPSSPLSPSPSSPLSPSPAPRDLHAWGEPRLETVAGARFFSGNAGSSEVEGPAGKIDLGNCVEVLELAKRRGLAPLQQASLGVMSDNYFRVLREPRLYGRLMAGERQQIQRLRTRGRRFLVAADMDPLDWGRPGGPPGATQRTSSGLHYYDDYRDRWRPLCPTPQEVVSRGCAMCTLDNYLFVALGCQGALKEMRPSNRVFCFNPATSIWREVSPMNQARPHCKMAALRGHVYAIGGECLSSVERYDPRDDRWSFVAPLPGDTFAVAHRVAVCNGEIFVSGGTLRYTLLRYNPQSNQWRRSLVVGSKERTVEMVGVRSFLYRFDVCPLLGISVHRYHAVARLWYECCTKRMLHCPAFRCVAVDDTIFCLSRQFTMRFLADDVSPAFIADDLSVLSEARGVLFPCVLALPEKKTLQTSV